MKRETAQFILQRISKYLDNVQMVRLNETLDEVLHEASNKTEKSSSELLEAFLSTKRLEGRSEKTLSLYRFNIGKIIGYSEKNVCVLTTEDIREYLARYKEETGISKITLDNMRRNLSSFFKWLEDENYIFKSPLRRIHKVKCTLTVKETYADEELERLRDDCKELRNLAIIDFLNSTGIRVGELVNLDISDVDFDERECVVLGKSDKERIVYFDARTKLHLKKYLNTREDVNSALFIALKKPHRRLKAGGIEAMLKKIGNECNVNHVYPHKFRRTMATNAIDKGMPIEQVQKLLAMKRWILRLDTRR